MRIGMCRMCMSAMIFVEWQERNGKNGRAEREARG